jgi:hypothetical protein
MTELLLDAAGRRRSPATMPGFHAGRPPRNKGHRYPADPPTVKEIVAVIRAAGDGCHGCRLRGLIVVLWRAGLRIHEALALNESDLDHRRGSLLVSQRQGRPPPRGRHGRVGVGKPAAVDRRSPRPPVGPLFCVINGPTRRRSWSPAAARAGCVGPPRLPACVGASRPISSATPTPSRWLTRASRSSSSSANSATATSASPRSISKESTTPRSSRPSTPAARPWSRSARPSGSEDDRARAARRCIAIVREDIRGPVWSGERA